MHFTFGLFIVTAHYFTPRQYDHMEFSINQLIWKLQRQSSLKRCEWYWNSQWKYYLLIYLKTTVQFSSINACSTRMRFPRETTSVSIFVTSCLPYIRSSATAVECIHASMIESTKYSFWLLSHWALKLIGVWPFFSKYNLWLLRYNHVNKILQFVTWPIVLHEPVSNQRFSISNNYTIFLLYW